MTTLEILEARFRAHPERHDGLSWALVEQRLTAQPDALEALARMEQTGGEPDVIGTEPESGRLIFCDCSKETPTGRRSLCYDDEALRKRTKNPPAGSAAGQAEAMGVQLMPEAIYRRLQELGEFDLKTSSWIETPAEQRALGGALFCERRYGRVFTFHNGADSYYSVRGWRGVLLV